MRAGRQSAEDVQHITTLLRAATRLNTALPEAYVWLYEFARLRGDTGAALDAADRLRHCDPGSAAATATWIETGVSAAQDVEARRSWLREALKDESLSASGRALAHVHLARLDLIRLDRDAARIQFDRAVAADADAPEVALLRLELTDANAPLADRVNAALAALRVNPYDLDIAWSLAGLLDAYGFSQEAGRLLNFALDIHQRTNPGAALPPTNLLNLAQMAAGRADFAGAAVHARAALAADPTLWQGYFMLHWLLTEQGLQDEADEIKQRLAAVAERVANPADWPVDDVAQVAWYYCTIEPRPEQALQFAQAAAAAAPSDPFVQRVLGWAQAISGHKDDAQKTLTPISGDDPYAAYQLARIAEQAGRPEDVRRIIDGLRRPATGHARDLLSTLSVAPAATQPGSRLHPEVADALLDFDWSLLDFHKEPSRHLAASMKLENPAPYVGEPWWAVVTLENRAGFPITLGPDRMVNPVLLLSYQLEGQRRQAHPYLVAISVDRARVLQPGEKIEIRQTLDIGPPRRLSLHQPQQPLRVTVQAILDAQRTGDGAFSPGLTGQQLEPLVFNRVPASGGRNDVAGLLKALSAEEPLRRFAAVQLLASLLGEHQRAGLNRLEYRPDPVPERQIAAALLSSLSQGDWQTRARTLDAMQQIGFDRATLDAVRERLEDPHWVVRLLAVRLLGERLGRDFSPIAHRIAADDADDLVRSLAESYARRWPREPAATQPTPTEGDQDSPSQPRP